MQAVAIFVLVGACCWGQDALGTWKLLAGKSHFEGPAPKALTVRYEPRGQGETWTFHEVRANGTTETTSQALHFDAQEHPCGDLGLEERPDTVVSRKPDARTADVTYKSSGRVARRMLRTVSEDGKHMTLEIRITPEKGAPVERRLVFERR